MRATDSTHCGNSTQNRASSTEMTQRGGVMSDLNSSLLLPSPCDKEQIRLANSRRRNLPFKEFMVDQFWREWHLFWNQKQWQILIPAAIMQYVHSIFTNVVFYYHRQGERLLDVGFAIFGQLSPRLQAAGDYLFFVMAFWLVSLMVSPFFMVQRKKPLFVVTMLARLGAVVSMAEVLRIMTFLVTILPSSADHCQPGSDDYDPPRGLSDILFKVDAFSGCGDLIFSSHTLITICFALVFQTYVNSRLIKVVVWSTVVLLSFSVIAARHHYSVDVLVAWYVVPMVWVLYSIYHLDPPFPFIAADKVNNVTSNDLENATG